MTGWAGATAQQASADETGAALGGAPWLNCEKSVGQQLLHTSNAQATLGRAPPRRLVQTTRIAVYRRITTCRTRSLAPDNPATRHLICRGAVCTFPEFKAAGLKMRLTPSPNRGMAVVTRARNSLGSQPPQPAAQLLKAVSRSTSNRIAPQWHYRARYPCPACAL